MDNSDQRTAQTSQLANVESAVPNIAILGAGSIGCYVGGCLLAANIAKAIDVKITFVGRQRVQRLLSKSGMQLSDWRGRDSRLEAGDIDYSLSAEVLANADYILVTVKSGDTSSAGEQIAAHATPTAIVVSFQNGVCNADRLQQALPNFTVLKGMVPFNVYSNGGHFHCGTEGYLAIEDKRNDATHLVELLEASQLPVTVCDDLTAIQWGKLLMNLNNSVNALAGIPLRDELHNATYRKVLAASIKEALVVLAAAGIKPAKTGKVVPALLPHVLSLPNWLFKRIASAMLKIDPAARSSMYEDLQLGRKTEVDYLNGKIVALAQKAGGQAPVNAAIVDLVKGAEAKQAGSPMLEAEVLYHAITTSNQ